MKKAIPSLITVCKDCEFRHVGCHSTCAPYLAQKAEHKRCKDIAESSLLKEKKAISQKIYYQGVRKRK